jgi:hypothetical protein
MPWIPAKSFITHESLSVSWRGFAWMNAPFGGRGELEPWLKKFFEHGDGTPGKSPAQGTS